MFALRNKISTKAVSWALFLLLFCSHQLFLFFAPHFFEPNKAISLITYILLAIMVLVGYYEIHKLNDVKIAYRLEHHTIHQNISLGINDVVLIGASTLGAVTIFELAHTINLPTILLASGITFILSTLSIKLKHSAFKSIDFAFYAGVFVGTTSSVIPHLSLAHIALSGALAGVLYVLSQNVLIGVGGRLGTFAFIAVWLIDTLWR